MILESKLCYDALEPLLRLAARDTQRFSDLTGETDKPRVGWSGLLHSRTHHCIGTQWQRMFGRRRCCLSTRLGHVVQHIMPAQQVDAPNAGAHPAAPDA